MKKKYLALFCAAFALVLLLGSVVLVWYVRYQKTGLAPLFELEGEYTYNGKLLIDEKQEEAVLYNPVGRALYDVLPRMTLDLSTYGFEGKSFPYFRLESDAGYGVYYVNYYSPDSAYEPFWSVCMGDRIVFIDRDGKKYRIHTEEDLCYPMFSDSVEGIDPYGADVIAFSANATYALALSGTDVTVYQTDPNDDSLRVVKKEVYSLAEYGSSVEFGAFVGNTDAYFKVTGEKGERYVALSCATGKTALSLLEEGEYGPAVSRLYAARISEEEEDKGRVLWSHLLLGTLRKSPVAEDVTESELLAVSPEGTYAVSKVERLSLGEDILVSTEKRNFFASSVLPEKEQVKEAVFLYENVVAFFCENEKGEDLVRVYKICF